MAAGVSGSFTIKGSKAGITCRVNYSETYDVEANTSSVTVRIQFKAGSGGYYGYTYYLDGSAKIDGTTVVSCSSSAGNASVYWNALESYAYMKAGSVSSWTKDAIVHNDDGSRSVTISVSLAGYTASGSGGSGWTVNGSQTIALTNIPRASDIGATDANIGAVSMVTVTRKSSAYTHSIAYAFGTLRGYLTASGGVSATEVRLEQVSVPFTLPASFYGQIPNAKSGTCTLTCRTWSGDTQIGGDTTCTFTATAAESLCAPAVSGTVTDANAVTKALTGDQNKLVRYFSTALCTITATAKNSAAIASRSIAGAAVSGNTRSIANVETGSFSFAAADSRGYAAAVTVTKPMVDYVRLTCEGTVNRPNPTANTAALALSGNFFAASFGAADNTLAVSYRVGSGGEVALTPAKSGGRWSAQATVSGVQYTESYTITVTAKDKLMTVTSTLTLKKGVPVFDWGEKDFRFNVPVGFTSLGQAAKNALRDFLYPVGCYYWSANATSPASLFGGTWEQVKDRFVLAAGGTYKAGETGGEAAHVLTAEEMPRHEHLLHTNVNTSKQSEVQNSYAYARWTDTYNPAEKSMTFAGGDAAHNNMPPYIVAYCWRRKA